MQQARRPDTVSGPVLLFHMASGAAFAALHRRGPKTFPCRQVYGMMQKEWKPESFSEPDMILQNG
jgi:hypothetical protein